jgi:hypothetical protein
MLQIRVYEHYTDTYGRVYRMGRADMEEVLEEGRRR